MLDRTEIERLAAAAAALRPDWPVKSLCTFLTNDHAHKAYRDVAVALAWIATDPATQTPKRMNEPGPWWTATRAVGGTGDPIRYARCPQPGHTSYPANRCGACRAEALGGEQHTPAPDPQKVEQYTRGAALARAALNAKETP